MISASLLNQNLRLYKVQNEKVEKKNLEDTPNWLFALFNERNLMSYFLLDDVTARKKPPLLTALLLYFCWSIMWGGHFMSPAKTSNHSCWEKMRREKKLVISQICEKDVREYRVIQNFYAPWRERNENRKRFGKFGYQKLKSKHFRATFENGLFLPFLGL